MAMTYLDHAATTPMRDEALAAYVATAREVGNASSLHAPGRGARRRVEEARERVAAALGARPSEVVFTGGGTESDNLAVKGIFWARRDADPRRNRLLAGAVEHHAVMDSAQWLGAHGGAVVSWLPVDGQARVRPEALGAELERHGDELALITTMWANNEVGTVQPIAELARIAADAGVPFHTDAVQAVGQIPVDFAASGVAAFASMVAACASGVFTTVAGKPALMAAAGNFTTSAGTETIGFLMISGRRWPTRGSGISSSPIG